MWSISRSKYAFPLGTYFCFSFLQKNVVAVVAFALNDDGGLGKCPRGLVGLFTWSSQGNWVKNAKS